MKGKRVHKDRIKGAAQQAKGAVQEVACKVTGDTKLQAEGKADKVADKVQNAVGCLKDMLRASELRSLGRSLRQCHASGPMWTC
jgi:uncharacterized protein YjbJ (UPF0337 family)